MAVGRFADRADAGRRLAERLRSLVHDDAVVLGLPRGGVPVAFEVATALEAPLDVIVVRKLGVPFQRELGMGAIGEGGVRILNREVVYAAGIDEAEFDHVERAEREELERRARQFRRDRPRESLQGRTAVIVDDGIATGSTARAACQVARALGAARVVLAVPVAPRQSLAHLAEVADDVVCLESPEPFFAVGQFYRDFSQTSDAEVVALLHRAASARTAAAESPLERDGTVDAGLARDDRVVVGVGAVSLVGQFCVPSRHRGIVVFVHGSGSSRHSPRNRFVAALLQKAGFGTLLFDLLTPAEEVDRTLVFDVALLTERLGAVTRWVQRQPEAQQAPTGYFGASTGAAAALRAAAQPEATIAAIVCRGGRPDLAGGALPHVRAPTLLIVGGRDTLVLELNRRAQLDLRCPNRLSVVPGATHLFEEPGALESVAQQASEWFRQHLGPAAT